MPKESIFRDEWRECLRAHYMDVVRRDDQRTLKSLVRVMHDTGFTDDELTELRVRATMRAEDAPEDFVPDMRIFQAGLSGSQEPVAEQPTVETEAAPWEVYHEAPEAGSDLPEAREDSEGDPDAPQQLSLF